MSDTIHELTVYSQRHGQPYTRWADDYTALKLRVSELEVQLEQLLPERLDRYLAEPLCELTCTAPCDGDCDCNPQVQTAWSVFRQRLIERIENEQ